MTFGLGAGGGPRRRDHLHKGGRVRETDERHRYRVHVPGPGRTHGRGLHGTQRVSGARGGEMDLHLLDAGRREQRTALDGV